MVTDSLAGVTARGAAQIADLANASPAAGGLGQGFVDQLPDYRGPAVYAAGRPLEDALFGTIALLMTVGAEGSCPHRVATVLQLGPDGRIRGEERFHRIDDLQRLGHGGPAHPAQPQGRIPHLQRARAVLRAPHGAPTRTHPTRL